MLSACFFCEGHLGSNLELESLPVGERIAFDASKGRLWVVCGRCGRWNLTPFDDRYETIEDCERKYRATKVRLQTDEIGMARLPSGLELVRIGKPVLPEFAAWRYGNELLRRHRWRAVRTVARVVGGPALIFGVPVVAAAFGPLGALGYAGAAAYAAYRLKSRPAVRVPLSDGDSLTLSREQVETAELIRAEDEDDQWAMWIGCLTAGAAPRGARLEHNALGDVRALLTGANGRMAAARILPHLNPLGGNQATVREAVHWLEAVGGPERALHTFARSRWLRPALDNIDRSLITVHPEARLALEMSLHEDEERRAMRGELTILRWAWHREEEIAAISDSLTDPSPAPNR
jgi:hypothetical protein